MSQKEMEFAVFCIEALAEHLQINGTQVYEKLSVTDGLLAGYIIPNYGVLHSQSRDYIIRDLIETMQSEGVL